MYRARRYAPRRRVYRRAPFRPYRMPRVLHGVGAYKSYSKRKYAPKRYSKKSYSKSYLSGPLSALGGIAGSYLGGPVGGALGSMGGSIAAQGIKALTGFGDYSVKKNVFSPGSPPQIINRANMPSGAIVVRHREFLGDVITSGSANTFQLQSYDLNPGIVTTFPWLSQLAANFTEYDFEGLLFEFRTMSADALNSTNTALGSVILATNYNAADANFATKSEMECSEYAQSVKPSECVVHLIECAKTANVLSSLYVRNGPVPSGQDQRMFDLGNFQLATAGFQGTSVNVGELWVSYQVVLKKSILTSAIGNTIPWCHFNTVTGVSNSAPLGTAQVATSGSTLACTIDSTGTILTIPYFPFKVTLMTILKWAGGSVAVTYPTRTFSSTVVVGPSLFAGNGSNSASGPQAGGTATTCVWLQFVTVTSVQGTANTITYGAAGTLPSSPTSIDIFIQQVPNQVN